MTDGPGLPPAEASDVLDFWFEELEPEQWWKPDPALDEVVRARFGDLYAKLSNGLSEEWRATPHACLAAVIVLDQFPRNMFRNDARAFGTDAAALALAESTLARGLDQQLTAQEKSFLYMPFQHSEDKEVQARSVDLFAHLDDAEQLRFAEQHKEIIDRFGRFPHRNAALGRPSTAEEDEFLKAPGLFW